MNLNKIFPLPLYSQVPPDKGRRDFVGNSISSMDFFFQKKKNSRVPNGAEATSKLHSPRGHATATPDSHVWSPPNVSSCLATAMQERM
uniref:Uncharacterized protein n=1 Tax=Arundo donax TaxID=35708 RepID=A0A0A9EH79_ARUDO